LQLCGIKKIIAKSSSFWSFSAFTYLFLISGGMQARAFSRPDFWDIVMDTRTPKNVYPKKKFTPKNVDPQKLLTPKKF
jgi:hypothetical protein